MVKKINTANELPNKDAALKDFLSDNTIFADVFNGVLFGGEQVLKPEALEDKDPTYALSFRHGEKVTKVSRYRDLERKVAFGCDFVICGLENQMKIHYAMPVRKLVYDGLEYVLECSLKAKQEQEHGGWTAARHRYIRSQHQKLRKCHLARKSGLDRGKRFPTIPKYIRVVEND